MKYTKDLYYQHLLDLLPESTFTLDVYNGTEQPCEITCTKCNSHYVFSQANLIARRAQRKNKNVCKKCEMNYWTKAQKDAEHKAKFLLEKKGNIKLISNLKSWASHEEATWLCLKCNHTFKRAPSIMFSQNALNCPWCETHPFEYTEDMIKEKAYELWGTEYSFLQIESLKNKNGSKRILVCHNKCNFKYSVSLWNFLHGQGCPKCKSSHGERKVRNYLQNHNILFLEQYTILVNNHYLKLDFYIESPSGRKFAIEYNGIQHYQPVSFFNGEQGFSAQKMRDTLKEQYCLMNNINLIIIPYNDESLLNSNILAQRLCDQVI